MSHPFPSSDPLRSDASLALVTVHSCPECSEPLGTLRVRLNLAGQRGVISMCGCYPSEVEVDDEADHRAVPEELVAALKSVLAAGPHDPTSAVHEALVEWADLLRTTPATPSERETMRAAAEYLRRGYVLVPLHGIENGHCTCPKGARCPPKQAAKHPLWRNWTTQAIRSVPELAACLRSRAGRATNLGVLLDPTQRLLLIDIDRKKGVDGGRTLESWGLELDIDFRAYRVQTTPSGGWHCLFRIPEGHEGPLPNRSGVDHGIDVFFESRQFVVSPSVTVKGAYRNSEGAGVVLPPIDELPVAPPALMDRLEELARGPGGTSRSGGLSCPVDLEALEAPSVELVREVVANTPNRLEASYTDFIDMAHYIKGACGRDNEADARDIFAEWAFRWEGDGNEPEVVEDKFASVSWSTLRSGFPHLLSLAERLGCDATTLQIARAADARRMFSIVPPDGVPSDSTATDGWEVPIPVGRSEEIEPFPLASLPPRFRAYVQSVASTLEVPVDLAGLNLMGGVAGAAQGRYDGVRVHEDYVEPLGLYLICQLPSGEGKTAAVGEFRRPFESAQQQLRDRMKPLRAQFEGQKQLLEEQRNTVRQLLRKASKELIEFDLSGPPDEKRRQELEEKKESLEERLVSAEAAIASLEEPAWPLLWLTEGTPEAISKHLAEQGSLIVSASEGDLIDVFAGQYTARGTAKLGPLLSAYSGESYSEARMDGVREVVNPRLTVVMTIQPSVVAKMQQEPDFASRGLTPRFLYSAPRSLVGHREWHMTDRIDRGGQSLYANLIRDLLGVAPFQEGSPAEVDLTDVEERVGAGRTCRASPDALETELRLSPEAFSTYQQYRRSLEPRLIDADDDLSAFREWGAKLAGQTLRIAAVLHLLDQAELGNRDPWTTPVPEAVIERAITIAEYFRSHMARLFVRRDRDKQAVVLDWIRDKGNSTFSPRDLYRSVRRHFAKEMKELDDTLHELEEMGWVREFTERRGAGRPARMYRVNPRLWEEPQADPPADEAEAA